MDRIIKDSTLIKPKHFRIIIPSVLIVILLVFVSTRSTVSTYKIPKEKVQLAQVMEGKFEDYIKVIGHVEPISTVYLDAMESGRIEEIYITEGSMVKKGDIILRLSNNNLNLSILDSEAQLAEKSNFLREVLIRMEQQKLDINRELINLEYELKKNKRNYGKKKLFYEQNLISEDEYLVAEENYWLSQKLYKTMLERKAQDSIFRSIQVEQMKMNLENMKKNLEYVHQRIENLNVKAPINGQLGFLDAEIGQSVPVGQRIGQVNVLTSYKIKCEIDEHYIDKVQSGLQAVIDRNGNTYNLKVKKVYPEVRDSKFEVDMVFTDTMPEKIRRGQTYYTNLQLGDPKRAIQLPRGGFFNSTGGQWIYVLDESEGFAIKRKIKLGRQNPKYFEVMEGLKPKEKVIISGYDTFGDNERILFK